MEANRIGELERDSVGLICQNLRLCCLIICSRLMLKMIGVFDRKIVFQCEILFSVGSFVDYSCKNSRFMPQCLHFMRSW